MVSIQKATNSLFQCNVLRRSQGSAHLLQYILPHLSASAEFVSFDIPGPSRNSNIPFPTFWAVRVYSTSHQAIGAAEHWTPITTAPTSAPVSLHFITKNEDTGDWPVSATVSYSRQSPLLSVYLAYPLETLGSVLGLRQLIVSVMSLAGTGSTQLQLHYCHRLNTVTVLQ